MSPRNLVYVVPLVTDEIEDRYGVEWYSVAGQQKMRGIIRSIQTVDGTVTVVSPVVPTSSGFSYSAGWKTKDPQTGATVVVPPTLNVFGFKYLTRLVVMMLTTLVVVQVHHRSNHGGTLFYNFRAITAVPAYAAQILFRCPAILEYEDGLFAHENTPIRVSAKFLRNTIGRRVRGAICVNSELAERLHTKNVAIVRGFPSIGYPEELPEVTVESEAPVVMFAGHFDEVRGIDTFLSLIPEIEEDVKFWISGTGKEHELDRVRAAVDNLDDDRVTYFGTLPWDCYRERLVSADIFVNLQDPNAEISKYTFPSKLLDFLSAGGLIISTDMSDLSEAFEDELLIADNTEGALVKCLSLAIERVADEHHPRETGRKWIRENCTEGRVGNRIFEVVQNAT